MTALLAPDPAVPQRDALLDERRMGALLGARLTGAAADGCERVNAKYRVGDSLRVVYRIAAGGESPHRRRAHVRRPQRERLPPRRRRSVPAGRCPRCCTRPSSRPCSGRSRTTAGWPGCGCSTAAPARSTGSSAAPVARDPADGLRARARRHRRVPRRRRPRGRLREGALGRRRARARQRRGRRRRGRPDDPHLRLPRVLAASLPDGALVLEPLAGRRLDGLAARRARARAARARRRRSPRCTRVRPLPRAALRPARRRPPHARRRRDRPRPAGLPRAPPPRLLARAARARRRRRAATPVHLHGDANLRNALLDGGRIALVDLEDAAAGPAAADLGFVLAGLLAARAQERLARRRAGRARRGAAARLRSRPAPSPTRRRCAGTPPPRRSPASRCPRSAACAPPCSPACEPLLRAAEELVA